MLFGVTDVAVVFAIFIFTTVPLTRYTIEGLRAVPPEIIEAAEMSGTSRRQLLTHVRLPLALPTMAVGFNQAIMFVHRHAGFGPRATAHTGGHGFGQEFCAGPQCLAHGPEL